MSKVAETRRVTVPDITALKGRAKIVCLTAYTAPVAALLDRHVDLLLVGDSLGMVVHGLPTPIGVTLEMMILHGQAVVRATLACAGGGRSAIRVVRGLFGTGLCGCGAGDEGDRLPGGKDRGGGGVGGDDRVSGAARGACDGPCRAAAAGSACGRRVQGQGAQRRRVGSGDRGGSGGRGGGGVSRSCWREWPKGWPRK